MYPSQVLLAPQVHEGLSTVFYEVKLNAICVAIAAQNCIFTATQLSGQVRHPRLHRGAQCPGPHDDAGHPAADRDAGADRRLPHGGQLVAGSAGSPGNSPPPPHYKVGVLLKNTHFKADFTVKVYGKICNFPCIFLAIFAKKREKKCYKYGASAGPL